MASGSGKLNPAYTSINTDTKIPDSVAGSSTPAASAATTTGATAERKTSGVLSSVNNLFKSKPSSSGRGTKVPRRLNFSELSGVFRRLDVNGDGQLDFQEFGRIARKLKLNSDHLETLLEEVFREADSGNNTNGTLDINEFRIAYNKLYTRCYCHDNGKSNTDANDATFVRATRYGTRVTTKTEESVESSYVFEVYLGYAEKISKKLIYSVHESSTDLHNLASIPVDSIDIDFTLRQLNLLILADNATNSSGETNLLWWVDFCTKKWNITSLNTVCASVGIPESAVSRIIDSNQRVSVDHADISSAYSHGNTGVCSLYCKSLCVRDMPVIHRDPAFVRKHPMYGLLPYLSSRFVFFSPWRIAISEWRKRKNEYQIMAKDGANDLEVLWDDDYLMHSEKSFESHKERPVHASVMAVGSGRQQQFDDKMDSIGENFAYMNIPFTAREGVADEDFGEDIVATVNASHAHDALSAQQSSRDSQNPLFLLSSTEMKQRPVYLDQESYSVHIQDHGSGPMVLYTFRECKSDLKEGAPRSSTPSATSIANYQASYSFEQLTRSGVLGRITIGVWRKLLEVIAHNGTATLCGHLTDTPFALAQLLISMVHSTSMQATMSRLDVWKDELIASVEDIAVTKHARHIDVLMSLLDEIQSYVQGFNNEVDVLAGEFYKRGGTLTSNFEASVTLLSKRPPYDGCIELQQSLVELIDKLKLKEKNSECLQFVETQQEALSAMHVVYLTEMIRRLRNQGNSQNLDEHCALAQRQLDAVKDFIDPADYTQLSEALTAVHSDNGPPSQDGAIDASNVNFFGITRALNRRVSTSAIGAENVAPFAGTPASSDMSPLSQRAHEISTNAAALTEHCSALTSNYQSTINEHADLTFDYQELDDTGKYDLFKEFTTRSASKQFNTSINLLPYLTRGYPKKDPINKEGTRSWQAALEESREQLQALQERYQRYLDEKRNFWSFLLGLVSIATFPFAVMTGYFGMNFENMAGKYQCFSCVFCEIWKLTVGLFQRLAPF
jgi:hypothetical protein